MFTNRSLFSVWLVTSPELFFPLGQDLPISQRMSAEGLCLWMTSVSNLSKNFKCSQNYDGILQVELDVGYICLLSLLFFIVTLETQSNCPNSVSLNKFYDLIENGYCISIRTSSLLTTQ